MSNTRLKTAQITTFFTRQHRCETPEAVVSTYAHSELVPLSTLRGQVALLWCKNNGVPDEPGDCRVYDFVRSDPADRPPNLFVLGQLAADHNLRRSVVRAYAQMGAHQPVLRDFPAHDICGRMRSFQVHWYERHKWLEYSVKDDAAYCLWCYLSSEVMMVEKDVSTFCQPSKGFRNWQKAMAKSGGFLTHIGDKLAKHRHAEAAFAELLCPTHNIEVALTAADNTQRINHRRRLGLIFDICMHLARQGIPFRGNDEKTTSMNKGNFLEMIDFMKEHVPEFSQLMRSAAGNAMYTSPDIQKQLVQCAADIVRKHIVRVELTGGVFSILVDEASCEAKRENMSIVIRFVCAKTGAIKECCLGVVHVRDTCAGSLFSRLMTQLCAWGVAMQRCRGQGYDGAPNMSGDYNGLQSKVREECPYAYYIHCFAHRLNLAVVATSRETVSVVECFNIVQAIHTTCSASCKRNSHLQEAARNELEKMLSEGYLETGKGKNQPMSTEALSSTRWNCRIRALLRVCWLWIPISNVLQRVGSDAVNYQKRADALGILDKMWTFNFVFHTEVLIMVLEKTNMLSQYLQKQDVDIASAVQLVRQIQKELKRMLGMHLSCEDTDSFSDTWIKAVEFCSALPQKDGITVPQKGETWTRRGHRSRGMGRPNVPGADDSSVCTQEHHYYVDAYNPIVKGVLNVLNRRFSGEMLELMELCAALSPKGNFVHWNPSSISRIAVDYYPNDFTEKLTWIFDEASRLPLVIHDSTVSITSVN